MLGGLSPPIPPNPLYLMPLCSEGGDLPATASVPASLIQLRLQGVAAQENQAWLGTVMVADGLPPPAPSPAPVPRLTQVTWGHWTVRENQPVAPTVSS